MPSAATATPPDGGYGYLVMAASWLGQFMVGTMFVGFATLMVDLAEHFQASQAAVALTGSLLLGSTNFCGILTGGLVHIFGSRPVCMVGALLCTLAVVSTSFTTSIYQTYFTYGILGGLGTSAMLLPSIVILQQYFDRKRAVTTGIASTGLSVGALVVGPVYRVLIDHFGWRGTLVIHGCLMLHGVLIGAIFRPLRIKKASSDEEGPEPKAAQWRTVWTKLVDLKLFRNMHFMLLVTGGLLWQYGVATIYNLGPSRAVSQGMDKFLASLLPSTIAICSVTSRIVNSFIGNMKCTNVLLQFGILTTCSGVVICLSCVTSTFFGSAVFAGVYGVCLGGFLALLPTVSVKLVGIDNASRAQGLIFTFLGLTALSAMPIGGWIYDRTSDYNISFMIGGILTILGGLSSSVIFFLKRRVQEQAGHTIPASENETNI